jgi:hypothetical protein
MQPVDPAARPGKHVSPYMRFPVQSLPPPVAAMISESAKAIGCDEALVAMPMLAVLGAAIGTTRQIRIRDEWLVFPILWTVCVADSGSQKSPAADVSLNYVRQREAALARVFAVQCKEYRQACRAAKKLKAAAIDGGSSPPSIPEEPVCRQVLVDDVTVEALAMVLSANPRGVLLARDELSGWFGSFDRYAHKGGADEPFFLKAYSGRSHSVNRRTGDIRSIHIERAAVWLTGVIPPRVLQRALGSVHRESGLLARLLLVAPPHRPRVWSEKKVAAETKDAWHQLLDQLYGLSHETLADDTAQPRVVDLAPEAKLRYSAFYDAHNVETKDLDADLNAAWSKLEEIPGRLALIDHEVRLASGEADLAPDLIDGESMRRAITLVQWFKNETRRVYAILRESDAAREVRQIDERLIAWIRERDAPVTARFVRANFRKLPTANAVEAALQRLVDKGLGVWRPVIPGTQGGRPTAVFVPADLGLPTKLWQTTAKPGFGDEPLSENDPAPENDPVIDPARPDDLDSEEEVRLGNT